MRISLTAFVLPGALAAVSAVALAAGPAKPAVYTAQQAEQGATVFSKHCVSCHGAHLQGKIGPALRGKSFQTMARNQGLNAATLLVFISQHMPLTSPGSLDKTQYDEVAAYILKENGYPAGNTKLTPSSATAREATFSSAVPVPPLHSKY